MATACGGGGDQYANEPAGRYPVRIVAAQFPARQQLDQNAYLRLGVRNTGRKEIPALAISITIGGEEGIASAQPFSVRDPQPGLSLPDRPVWILADTYPRIAGVPGPGGAETANQKTFNFGKLPPGDARVAVWKLGAVRPGRYLLRYRVNAGLSGQATAVTAAGRPPIGDFDVRIARVPQLTRINAEGEIVPLRPAAQAAARAGAASGSGGSGSPGGGGYAVTGPGSYPPSGSLPPSGSGQ
ncbi:MAG: hypothetical protein U0R52_11310 [Solirubrobacterales bacterium]